MTITLEKPREKNNNLVLTGISWEKFEEIETFLADLGVKRFIYLDGELEIITNVSREHQEIKSTIGMLLANYMRKTGIRFYMRGSATLGNKEIAGRKEPDESYNIHSKKDIPDLIIEVIVTSGGIEILEIYKRIGIPEVWFYSDGVLNIYCLTNNIYQKVKKSQLLPDLDIQLLTKYINYDDQYDAVTEFIELLK